MNEQATAKYVGYVRVSTPKQGERGVSLQEQRDAITRFAGRHGMEVVDWFEERETAAKRGRPVFAAMLRHLRQGKAAGVVVHKIDRSARNLSDWAELGTLIDEGIEVRFATEDLDLRTRGGRLTADIQAVVAADYVRNLREEAKKGIYGRLKQGIYPLPAPTGYLDQGAGKPKAPDPATAPFIRLAFERYANDGRTLETLLAELHEVGLRSRRGGPLSLNGLSTILRNPFYVGLIRIRKTKEVFEGAHEPLVSKVTFERVQARLDGKVSSRGWRHAYLFRRLLACAHCGYALIGERQKGRVYYRCHTRGCLTKSVREEAVERALRSAFAPVALSEAEQENLLHRLEKRHLNWAKSSAELQRSLNLQSESVAARLDQLTDAYLDGAIDRGVFTRRKERLLLEARGIAERQNATGADDRSAIDRVKRFLELVSCPDSLYESALESERRSLVDIATSNRSVLARNIGITLSPPFSLIAERETTTCGGPYRGRPRTSDALLDKLITWFSENPAGPIDRLLPVAEKKDTPPPQWSKYLKRAG